MDFQNRERRSIQLWIVLIMPIMFNYHAQAAGEETKSPRSAISIAKNWYVDGLNGDDRNSGLTMASPLKTTMQAWKNARPGDTIHLLPTMAYGPQYFASNAGMPSAPITIQGDGVAPNRTRIIGNGQAHGLRLASGTRYVNIRNLDISAPGPYSAISIMKGTHINVLGNYLHDSGAAGINTHSADYITIDGNTVSNNAWYTTSKLFGSGISTGESVDSDANAGIKMVIKNNVVYGNTNRPLPGCMRRCNSDGSGIIIDDNRRTQTDNHPYRGTTLIENNVIYGNGGRGIHIYYSDNVIARGNRIYLNNQDPYEDDWNPGEIEVSHGGGVNIYRNVLYSDGRVSASAGQHYAINIKNSTSGRPIVVDYNTSYNLQNAPAYFLFTFNNRNTISIGKYNRWRKLHFNQENCLSCFH